MSQDKPNPKARHIHTSALDQEKIKGINEQLHRIQQIKSTKLRRSSDQPKKEDIEELPLETVDSMIGFATQGDLYRNDLDLLFDRITGEADAPVYQAPEPEPEPIAPPAAALEALPSASKQEEGLPHEDSNGGFEFVPSEQPAGGFEFDMSGGSGGLDDGDFDLDNLQLDLSFMTPGGSPSAPEGEAGGFEFDMSGGEGGAEPAQPSKPVSLLERVATPTPQPQILGGYSLNELDQLKSLPTPPPTHSKGSPRVTSDDTSPQTLVSNTLVSNTLVSNSAHVELEGGSFEPFDFNELQDAEVEVLSEDTDSEEFEMDALASLMDFAEPAGAVEDAPTSPGSLLEGDEERDMWREAADEDDDD